MLQNKVGKGPLDQKIVEKAQNAIDNNEVDFTPLGLQFLEKLSENLNKVEKELGSTNLEEQKQLITRPVMELKANATIFHYSLIGNLANIMLSFLESINEIDKDALSIVRAHHTTLNAIILKKMKGDGGQNGEIFMSELKQACARYYSKKKKEKQA
ncbi:MAG: hypothetical protein GW903_06555 [Alphaproteobacteria bacterium]|nr:hypothetical protein [Alphaproteobacteria bacterium]NCT06085.1 hypothetical protein [Alphaproteobacteria bacterium]